MVWLRNPEQPSLGNKKRSNVFDQRCSKSGSNVKGVDLITADEPTKVVMKRRGGVLTTIRRLVVRQLKGECRTDAEAFTAVCIVKLRLYYIPPTLICFRLLFTFNASFPYHSAIIFSICWVVVGP